MEQNANPQTTPTTQATSRTTSTSTASVSQTSSRGAATSATPASRTASLASQPGAAQSSPQPQSPDTQPAPVMQPGAPAGQKRKWSVPRIPISFNAPVILGFAALSLIALLLGLITGGAANTVLFSTYRTSALDPLAFVRMFTYVLGHADFEHWISNITLLLIVGPMIEEKYGSVRTLLLILITAVSTALVNDLLFSTGLMGASGVVFAMVLLSSFASYEKGSIPLTLILVAVILIGGQVVAALQPDNVSQFAHIFGGLIGCAAGFLMNRKPRPKKGKK